jgi:hypothetical protein
MSNLTIANSMFKQNLDISGVGALVSTSSVVTNNVNMINSEYINLNTLSVTGNSSISNVADCHINMGALLGNCSLSSIINAVISDVEIGGNLIFNNIQSIQCNLLQLSSTLTSTEVDKLELLSSTVKDLTLNGHSIINLINGSSTSLTISDFSECNMDNWTNSGASTFSDVS